MKKLIFILCSLLFVFACQDYNEDNFDGYEELEKPKNVGKYELTISEADITAILSAIRGTDAEQYSDALRTNMMFSDAAPADALVPYLLEQRYYSADVGSTADVTYNYRGGGDSTLISISGSGYVVSENDYKSVWGNLYVPAFTPEKSPEKSLPVILAQQFPDAKAGDYKNVEYYYSSEEPVNSIVEGEKKLLLQDFEDLTASNSAPMEIPGWINYDLEGSVSWQCREYSGNKYTQVTGNNTGVVSDVWLVSSAVDLTDMESALFSFDIIVGYYNGNGLSVLISDDFDGNEASLLTASWTDITENFTIPQEPASGYSQWVSAGTYSTAPFAGKTVYIAFRYQGNDSGTGTKLTTTYQMDNIKVVEGVAGLEIEDKEIIYATYQYNNSVWQQVNSDNLLILQPDDYKEMGITYLSADRAVNYLPTYLAKKYSYTQEGTEKTVVYKTGENNYNADKLVFTGGTWTIENFVETRTEQFARAGITNEEGKVIREEWIFDPTFRITMDTADYQVIVEYVADNIQVDNPNIVHANRNAEYYYGFSAHYKNISYREIDRSKDETYPISGTDDEKIEFMNQRTIEGLAKYLSLAYPDAEPLVNGIEQKAKIYVLIYMEPNAPNNVYWTYTMKCVADKEWEFIERESENGRHEVAGE